MAVRPAVAGAGAAAGAETEAALRGVAERVAAAGQSSPRQARDPVNLPMIRNWLEAIGDASLVYTDAGFAAASVHGGLVAPPAMVQVWTMPGLNPVRDVSDPLAQMSAALDAAGYTSVVATNCDQVYHRYLRHGEQLTVRIKLVDLTGPKRTALGDGWFCTTRSTWYCADEAVATMDFRILKFRPPDAQAGAISAPADPDQAGVVIRPLVSPDTAFFWDGTAAGELRIQRCGDCGVPRHPPGPMCPACGAANAEYAVAAGTGEVFSYTVHHHPPVPGKRLPIVIVLVRLDEGVRMIGELVGADPGQVRIGLPVRAEFVRIDDKLTLPAWRPAGSALAGAVSAGSALAGPGSAGSALAGAVSAGSAPAGPASGDLPELVVQASTTFVIAAALATRDFQDVHHDRDRASARGSKDIFLNILTSTGLVQRFVSEWAGPHSVLRRISIRLGVPCYAGDTLTFSGHVTQHLAEADGDQYEVAVVGRCSLGDHVTGTVLVDLPGSRP